MGHLVRLSYPEAPNGAWSISAVGGATVATAFSDPDCQFVKTGRALSALGRDLFYLNTPAVVTVVDSTGVVVDGPFTEGSRAELTGVYSPFFTGTLPNGTQGLGGYQSLLDTFADLATSFGSIDGKVKETGQVTPLLLKDALQAIRQANLPYFNVKAAPYNAVGDGTALDGAAIQAAIDAAAAAGGGVVYVPRGTYLCPTPLSVTHRFVSVLGDGPGASLVKFSGGAGYAFTFTGSSGTAGNFISNVGVAAVTAGGLLIDIALTQGFRIDRCYLEALAVTSPAAVRTNFGGLIVNNTFNVTNTTAARGTIEINGNQGVSVSNNVSITQASPGNFVRVTASTTNGQVVVVGNTVPAVGAFLGVAANAGQYSSIGNNGIGYGIESAAGSEACGFSEVGHSFGMLLSGTGLIGVVCSATHAQASINHLAGTVFSPVSIVEENVIDLNGTPATINAAPAAWNGAQLVLRMRNTSGAPVVMNYNAAYLQGGAVPGNLANGATRVSRYVRRETGGSTGWRLVSSLDST